MQKQTVFRHNEFLQRKYAFILTFLIEANLDCRFYNHNTSDINQLAPTLKDNLNLSSRINLNPVSLPSTCRKPSRLHQ